VGQGVSQFVILCTKFPQPDIALRCLGFISIGPYLIRYILLGRKCFSLIHALKLALFLHITLYTVTHYFAMIFGHWLFYYGIYAFILL